MKKVEHIIPFIDIVFQALGALIVVMATLQHVEAIPVDLATVGKEARVAKSARNPLFVVISKKGLFSGKREIAPEELAEAVRSREVILRIDKDIAYGKVIQTIAGIQDKAKHIALEVKKDE